MSAVQNVTSSDLNGTGSIMDEKSIDSVHAKCAMYRALKDEIGKQQSWEMIAAGCPEEIRQRLLQQIENPGQ